MTRRVATLLLISAVGLAMFGVLRWRAGPSAGEGNSFSAAATAPAGDTIPPPLPAAGTPDPLVGLHTVPEDLLARYETREYEYESKAVAVFGVQGNWYLVHAVDGGRAWLPAGTPGRFIPVDELVVNGLNFLTEAWDGEVLDAPAIDAAVQEVTTGSRRNGTDVPANVVEARRAAGTLWFRVEVLDRSPCTADTTRVLASGWIRAWGPGGQPAAWFYSRGC
jgi:hypothetical protein